MKEPSVVIVVLNWNGGQDTAECLRSLARMTYSNFRVIVVDNASTDDSVSIIEDAISSLPKKSDSVHYQKILVQSENFLFSSSVRNSDYTLLISPDNGGFAAGNNYGVRSAMDDSTCEYVWLLNNDVEVHPDALSALVRRANPSVSVVGSVLVFHDTRDTVQCVGGVEFNIRRASGMQIGQGSRWSPTTTYTEPVNITYIAGASMLISAKTIRKGGLMDERYFLYFEEIDWAHQLVNEGKLAVATESIVFHKEGASIGTASRGKRSQTSQYYLSRNLILFYRKWYPKFTVVAVIRNLREVVRSVIAMDINISKTILFATVDGLIGKTGKR